MDERNWQDARYGAQYGRQSAPYQQQYAPNINNNQNAQSYAPYGGGYQQPRQSGVVINSPKTYEDVQRLIDHLKLREQVIVDFSNVDQQSVYRILDFMSGAIYALGGSIQPIHKNIFLFAPAGVTITIPPQFNRK